MPHTQTAAAASWKTNFGQGRKARAVVLEPHQTDDHGTRQERHRAAVAGPEGIRDGESQRRRHDQGQAAAPRRHRAMRRALVRVVEQVEAHGNGLEDGDEGQHGGQGQQGDAGQGPPGERNHDRVTALTSRAPFAL